MKQNIKGDISVQPYCVAGHCYHCCLVCFCSSTTYLCVGIDWVLNVWQYNQVTYLSQVGACYLLYLVPPRYCLDMGSITKPSSSFSLLFWGERLSTGIGSSRCSPCNPAYAIIKQTKVDKVQTDQYFSLSASSGIWGQKAKFLRTQRHLALSPYMSPGKIPVWKQRWLHPLTQTCNIYTSIHVYSDQWLLS